MDILNDEDGQLEGAIDSSQWGEDSCSRINQHHYNFAK
jgi:hypothetical protein